MDSPGAVVASLYIGKEGELGKVETDCLTLELDGIVGDRHRGISRACWEGDKQPVDTIRRNERQWSAISSEELAEISHAMGLAKPLLAGNVGVNLCLSGVPDLSRLPRGTTLSFPSGAVLMVEEYNPPCADMGAKIAAEYKRTNEEPIATPDFSAAAKFCRGVVGVVEVPGSIQVGDEVRIEQEQLPKWLR